MTDTAALTRSLNLNEPGGNEISIYTIGLGAAGGNTSDPFTVSIGEQLLRYMAAVGDDGDRETDPCETVGPRRICGQYYFAPSGAALEGIFLISLPEFIQGSLSKRHEPKKSPNHKV